MSKLNKMEPKSAMALGIIGGILLIGTIGFIVLLIMFLRGGNTTTTKTTNVMTNTNTNAGTTPSAQQKTITVPIVKSTDHYRGDKNAKVTIIEFSDPECPFCKRFHSTMNQLMKIYGNKIKWVYKHAPLDSLHTKARTEAEASECVAELGGNTAFWKFINRLYEITPSNNGLAASKLPEISVYAGVDKTKFNTCLSSKKHSNLVQSQLKEAEAAGMQGTPYSIIVSGNKQIPISGAYSVENMKSIIDQLLK